MNARILLVSAGIFHPPLEGRRVLRKMLEQMDGYSFAHSQSLERVPANLEAFAAMVLYIHQEHISPAALERLEDFVRQGGGLLAIHSATASFKTEPRYAEILGGSFRGHGPVEQFTLQRITSQLFTEVDSFRVKDELYQHEFTADVQVHYTVRSAGQEIPAVWTHIYGAGRVCYASPGHTAATMRSPAYQPVLWRGLEYAAGGQP